MIHPISQPKLSRSPGNTRYPFIILNLEIPPSDVDVNVHPTKKEVRYKNPNQIFNFIYSSVDSALKSIIEKLANKYQLIIPSNDEIDKKKNVLISFNDTGIGIAPDKINRIFDPFYSGDNASDKKGSGLGLSIAKSIVEKSGGKISVSSTLGAGSCFTVSFPAIKTIAKK